MSSMASPRAALTDTTAAVLNQPTGSPLTDSLPPPSPSPSAVVDSSPAKSRRRGWDKSRLSLPIWLPNNDSENQPLIGHATDTDKPASVTQLAQLPAIIEPSTPPSAADETGAETGAGTQLVDSSAASVRDKASIDQVGDVVSEALISEARADSRAKEATDADTSVSTSRAAAVPSTATAASPVSSGIPKPPTAPYHTRSRQQSAHNATFSHSMRHRSASPTPTASVAALAAAQTSTTTRRTASIAATAAIVNSKSSHAASAASLLSQAANMINKSKASSAAAADSAAASRTGKRALSKKEEVGHKRRKSTEAEGATEAVVKADEADASSKPPAAPARQSVAGRQSVSGSSRSQRQSLSISNASMSSPRSTPTKLRSYSRHSISASPLHPPSASTSSIGTQTASSTVEADLQAQLATATVTLTAVQQHNQSLQSQLQSSELELSRLSNNQVALQSQIFQLTVQQQDMRTENAATKERLRCEEDKSSARQRRVDECEAEMGRLQLAVARLEAEAREAEEVRRRLHAYVEEMKGNVRVMVRVRPTLPHESNGPSDTFAYLRDRDMHLLEVSGKEERSVDGTTLQRKKQHFVFDHVFAPSASQSELFEQVKSLIVTVLDGYDVLVFAYGQTGAGKSFSMEGPAIVPSSLSTAIAATSTSTSSSGPSVPRHRHTPTSFSLQSDAQYEQRGLIQRSVEQLFADISQRKAKGWSFHVQVSVVELYNDAIRDLLVDRDTDKHEIKQVHRRVNSAESDWQQLGETRDDKLDVVVSNVHTVLVGCPSDVYPLLDRARLARASGATEANAHSSRSHLIVRLHVQASNAALQQRSDASLHLIDLAGSERVKVSKADGSRLKETAAINRSLSALADVIQALSVGDKHVPYRNSRLTHMLQPYLAGSASKSLMLVNLNPHEEHVGESLCSLRFAQTVSGCGGKRR